MIRLDEVTRRNILGKTKSQSPDRFNRRLFYKSSGYKMVDMDQLLLNDILVVQLPVGDYICTLAFPGVIADFKYVIDHQSNKNITLKTVIQALNRAFTDPDIKVDCTCSDFIYRFSYFATKYDYKWGKPETRPPKITNPNNNIGAVCKHLSSVLANKSWIPKVAQQVNRYLRDYPEFVADLLDVPEDYLVWNQYENQYDIYEEHGDENLIPNESNENEELIPNIEDNNDLELNV